MLPLRFGRVNVGAEFGKGDAMVNGNPVWVAVAAVFVVLLGFVFSRPALGESSRAPGRYQVVNPTPEFRARTMLLDTATGDSWIMCSAEEVRIEPLVCARVVGRSLENIEWDEDNLVLD
jgi:hypothetical protein